MSPIRPLAEVLGALLCDGRSMQLDRRWSLRHGREMQLRIYSEADAFTGEADMLYQTAWFPAREILRELDIACSVVNSKE